MAKTASTPAKCAGAGTLDRERLKRVQDQTFENGRDIVDAADHIRRVEKQHVYPRLKPQ